MCFARLEYTVSQNAISPNNSPKTGVAGERLMTGPFAGAKTVPTGQTARENAGRRLSKVHAILETATRRIKASCTSTPRAIPLPGRLQRNKAGSIPRGPSGKPRPETLCKTWLCPFDNKTQTHPSCITPNIEPQPVAARGMLPSIWVVIGVSHTHPLD